MPFPDREGWSTSKGRNLQGTYRSTDTGHRDWLIEFRYRLVVWKAVWLNAGSYVYEESVGLLLVVCVEDTGGVRTIVRMMNLQRMLLD